MTKKQSAESNACGLGQSRETTVRPISALEYRPFELVREVSKSAINFYACGLSGLYLPDDFKQANKDAFDVKYWDNKDRLRGKFGRFTVQHVQGETKQGELDDILLMGTTIDLSSLDRDSRMESLRHYSLKTNIQSVLQERGLTGLPLRVMDADFGGTWIKLDDNGVPRSIVVDGYSYDYGRATAKERRRTCKLFEQLVGGEVEIINADPEPGKHEYVIT